jgi:NosR/NirI family nitrous oxide reductase transcriptional regulator
MLTFVGAALSEFRWDFFLLEPLMFILWCYVAVAMLFLGRGVFCGWLCPFGALQELLSRGAVRIGLPQWRLPFALHERLWPIKYIVFLALFALFLGDLPLAMVGAEAEPFKTAIVLKFDRQWPFVLYALGLLAAGLFVNRAFCRYRCPLGAALAIPARLRMFDWLKRRWQCGNPCHECALTCPVQAIHPEGRINPNECIHCLRCQVNYYDEYLCPPLMDRRKRHERRAIARARNAQSAEGGQ